MCLDASVMSAYGMAKMASEAAAAPIAERPVPFKSGTLVACPGGTPPAFLFLPPRPPACRLQAVPAATSNKTRAGDGTEL